MGIFSRKPKAEKRSNPSTSSSDDKIPNYNKSPPTLLRSFTIFLYLASTVFLILVLIGNISNKPVIRNTYFLRINLANIIPESVPNAIFINSIARSIGLHDFYQVGLWSFAEGYQGEGITYVSNPKALYWFNPVEIILNELLSGASIALPVEAVTVLDIVKIASNWMFACYLVGISLTFICIFIVPCGFSKKPRWSHKRKRIFLRQLPITILSFLAFLFVGGPSVIATVMFVIFRNTFLGAADLNIEAHLGSNMLAFTWVATGLNLIGLVMQLGTCCGVCCCTGKRKAESKAFRESRAGEKGGEGKRERGRFGFGRKQ